MNTFDFYSFEIALRNRSEAKKLGLDIARARSEKSYVTYGSGFYAKRYPKFNYHYTVGFMDAVNASTAKVDAYADELSKKYNRPVHIIYTCRD